MRADSGAGIEMRQSKYSITSSSRITRRSSTSCGPCSASSHSAACTP
jgi:hypothetical protein